MLRHARKLLVACSLIAVAMPLFGQSWASRDFSPAGIQFSVPSDWTPQAASGTTINMVSPDKKLFVGVDAIDVSCSIGDQQCLIGWLQNSFPNNARSSGMNVVNGSVVAQPNMRNNLRGATFQMATTDGIKLAGFAGFHNGKVFTVLVAYRVEAEGFVTQNFADQVFNSITPVAAALPPPVVWRIHKQLSMDSSRCARAGKQALSDNGYVTANIVDTSVGGGVIGGHLVYGTSDHEVAGVFCNDGPNGITYLDVVLSTSIAGTTAQSTRTLADRVENYALSQGR